MTCRPRYHGLAAAAGWALFAAAAAAGQPPNLAPYATDKDNVKQLEKGKLVALDDVDFGELFGEHAVDKGKSDLILFLIEEPAESLWDILHDFESHDGFMPRMEESKVEKRDRAEYTFVCYTYDVLWIESTNCFHVRSDPNAMTVTGVLDETERDDRLEGVNYFWHLRPWRDGRTLVAYYQKISYSGGMAAFGHRAFVGPKTTAGAIRKRVEEVAEESKAR